MTLLDATRETFADLVAEGTVLVDVWGPECRPCLALLPHVEEMARQLEGRVKVIKLEAPKARRLCMELGLLSLPCFVLFHCGAEVGRLGGPEVSAPKLDDWFAERMEEVSNS
ncbi:MAG: thioredoxin family protein [Acidimicrobiales bacterium]